MPNTDQAQADPTDDPTVSDPLDTENTHDDGTSELSSYADEIAALNLDEIPGDEPEEETAEGDEIPEEEQSADEDAEEANEESSEEDAGEEPEPATSNRFRIRAKDDVEAEALALRKRHPDLSLKDCIAKAELILGVEVASEQAQEEVSQGDTVESVNAKIEELRRLRKDATSEMEFDTVSDLTDQIDDLRDQREELKVLESQVQAEKNAKAEQSFESDYAKSERLTVTYYPDTTNPESPMVKRMVELDRQMLEVGDPLYHSPDKPFLLAKAAARELGVIMTKPGAAPAKPSRSSKSPMQPAPGNRGTTSTDSSKSLEAEIDALDSLADYERRFGRG
jgi:hypothetical protein